jgi:hypothetical protein
VRDPVTIAPAPVMDARTNEGVKSRPRAIEIAYPNTKPGIAVIEMVMRPRLERKKLFEAIKNWLNVLPPLTIGKV